MKIAVIGTGYVGLSTGVCLAEMGHHVACVDTDERKIASLREGKCPIYEPGMEDLLVKNGHQLMFTTSLQDGMDGAEVIIIAVGTPQSDDGSADLSYLFQAVRDIRPFLHEETVVVIKSTVPIGTNAQVANMLLGETAVVSNPEFLRQGSAVQDTLFPDRVVIGAREKWASDRIADMYEPLHAELVITDPASAEFIKYASNSFLAMKISFINHVAGLCEVFGANVESVSHGMGLDKRIGRAFLQAGTGYGGSCFPKDVSALNYMADQAGIGFGLLKETMRVNEKQKTLLVRKAKERFGSLQGMKIALLGLAFKPETDDMREAPAITIVDELLREGASVVAYDPVAMDNAKRVMGDCGLAYVTGVEEAVVGADAVLLVTEWKEIVEADWAELVKKMKQPIIFDGRNGLAEKVLAAVVDEVEYYPVGKPAWRK